MLRYDLPGVGLEDEDITLDGNLLTTSGEHKVTTEEGVDYYLNELPYASFRRTVTVPEGIDADSGPSKVEQRSKSACTHTEVRTGRTVGESDGNPA